MPLEARGLGQAFFNITSFLSRTERFGTVPWTESSRPMRRTLKDQVVALVSLSCAEFDVDCLFVGQTSLRASLPSGRQLLEAARSRALSFFMNTLVWLLSTLYRQFSKV